MRGGNGVVIAAVQPPGSGGRAEMPRPWEAASFVPCHGSFSCWYWSHSAAGPLRRHRRNCRRWAAAAGSPVLRPLRPCGDLTSVSLLSPTRVPVQLSSARVSGVNGAGYCDVMGEIGPGFSFDLHLPQSTYEGQYVQEGCGGFCGFAWPSAPFVADGCPAVTGNTLAIAVDNEGHASTSTTDAALGGKQHEEPHHLRLQRRSTSWPLRGQARRSSPTTTWEPALLLVLRRVLRRRARSTHGGAAVSARLQRDFGRGTGKHLVGAPGRGRELEHSGQHRERGVERSSPPRSSRRSTRPWYGHVATGGDTSSIPAPAISPRRGSSAEARTAIPASRQRRSESRPCSTAAPRTRLDEALVSRRRASYALRSLGWPTWFVKPSGDRDWLHR